MRSFARVVDLTHLYSAAFPHFRGGGTEFRLESESSTANGDGWNVRRWTIDEHSGTHIDAPIHRVHGGLTVAEIPAQDLVLPLVVIDIREAAQRGADAELTVDDVLRFESRHGPIPDRACVALHSGWEQHLGSTRFFGVDSNGTRHFPGFHAEVIELFLETRRVLAIASDTASLDHGSSTEFPVHTRWLGAGRWGLENVARLGELPPLGATIVCGAPKIEGATGGPSRVLALV